jgi:hypothetical protein
MTRFGVTGATVPGWIRETVRRHEEAWPVLVLTAAAAVVVLSGLVAGMPLWISDAPVYYALP